MKDTIIIHCSATRAGQDFTATDIDRWHRQRGFRSIGYHFVIRLDGTIEPGRDVALDGAHCTGWNHRSIGICYIGGLDRNGRPADTRTEAQREALVRLVEDLRLVFPSLKQVIGHRDTSTDLNGDGIISPDEYIKSCPCFDVKAEFIQYYSTIYNQHFIIMVRISKPGLDYFPLDVNFLQDRKVRRISCRHHAAGIAALTSLLCLIYKEKGYYIL